MTKLLNALLIIFLAVTITGCCCHCDKKTDKEANPAEPIQEEAPAE